MTDHRHLACGCVLGWERCFDCRPGLDIDQEKALAVTLEKLKAAADDECGAKEK